MEVLFAGYDPTSGREQGGVLVVDSAQARQWRPLLGGRLVEPAPYVTAQGRASMIGFDNLDDLLALLAHADLASAAAQLNQWLRATAQAPSLQSQWHVPEFTRWLLPE
jgi:hypothetical protein